jgi:hypothetical protein
MSMLISMASSASAIPLVVGGSLSPSVSFTRASPAWSQDASGIWRDSPVDSPRWDGSRFVVEGDRRNAIRNPRFEGAAAPSTSPTYTNLTITNNGVAMAIVGTGTDSSLPYLDLSFIGTATANAVLIPTFESSQGVPASTGQTWVGSMFIRHVSGTLGNFTSRIEPRPSDSTNTVLAGFTSASNTASATWTRMAISGVLSAANVAYIRLNWRVGLVLGRVYNEVIRIAVPTLEDGNGVPFSPFASSPMLPPVGTLAETIRPADKVAFPINGTFGSMAFGFMLPQQPTSGINQGLLILDNGSNVGRATIFNTGGTNTITAFAGGTGQAGIGSMTPGVPTAIAVRWSSEGVFAKVRGSEEVRIGDKTITYSVARLGTPNVTYTNSAFGSFGPVHLYNSQENLTTILNMIP